MWTSFTQFLHDWNKNTSERIKLQHTCLVLGFAILILAGLVGLLNYHLGQTLVGAALGIFLVFVANAVIWALLQSFIISRIPRTPRKK